MLATAVFCHNLHKSFGDLHVVNAVSLRVTRGQILTLLGPSGCGKTTTLRLIAGFERPDSGLIEISGQTVADGQKINVPPEKRRAGMVFQDYAIFPHLSVLENVRFGLEKGKAGQARAEEMLAFVGMAGLGNKMPHELSGGQQQRVALARALAPNPVVLLLDEPFSNLDAALRASVRLEVKQLLKESQATAVFVTHDQEEALLMSDEVAVMNEGRLEQVGPPLQVFHQPRTRFVATFMGQSDFLPGQVNGRGVMTPLGYLEQPTRLPPGTAVDVLLRANDVHIVVDEKGNGRIRSRQFMGIAFIYEVALENGGIVHSWQPHTLNLAEGTAVQVSFAHQRSLSIFHGDFSTLAMDGL